MRIHRGLLPTAGLAVLTAVSFARADGDASADENATTLAYQPCPEWSFILPKETWIDAESSCGVPHARDTAGFATERTGVMALEVDTNGDGKLDEKVKGARGFAKLRGETSDGKPFSYAVRFKFEGTSYKWSAAGLMTGKIHGQTIKLIDQNGNGEYDDYGADAMIIGSSPAASFLSRVVNLGGELFDLDVTADGTKLSVKPYEGETGTLDLQSKFQSNGTLVSAVVLSGDNSFDLAGAGTGLLVPAGKYELTSGFVEKAGETCWIRRGKAATLDVRRGTKLSLEWGAAVVAEFDYKVEGDEITVQPNVAFFGQAGEEYHSFRPEAKSPKLLITDKATGKLVASGRFGGC